MIKRFVGFLVVPLLASACGLPPEGGVSADTGVSSGEDGGDREVICQEFIDTTLALGEPGISHADYQLTLSEAARPLVDWAMGGQLLDDEQAFLTSLERIYAGDAVLDDMWAIEDLGGTLAAGGGSICEELGRNVGFMPPPPGTAWDTPPEVEIVSTYQSDTADYVCDVFIQTIDIWVDDANVGAEYGPHMADQVDLMIGGLRDLGIETGLDQLAVVSDKWRTLQWVQGQEESGRPLTEAAAALAGTAPRCGELFQALRFDPEPAPPTDYADRWRDVEAVAEFDPGLACGSALVPSGELIPSLLPLDVDAWQTVDAMRALGPEGESFVDGYAYGIFSRTDDELVLLGVASDGSLSDAHFRRADGIWDPDGWGSCEWRPSGFRAVEWQIHPDHVSDLASLTIELLVVDKCGVVFERNHEVVVVAEYTDDAVTIEVWQALNPPPSASGEGLYTTGCVIGATLGLIVHLPGPLGGRVLVGAADSLNE